MVLVFVSSFSNGTPADHSQKIESPNVSPTLILRTLRTPTETDSISDKKHDQLKIIEQPNFSTYSLTLKDQIKRIPLLIPLKEKGNVGSIDDSIDEKYKKYLKVSITKPEKRLKKEKTSRNNIELNKEISKSCESIPELSLTRKQREISFGSIKNKNRDEPEYEKIGKYGGQHKRIQNFGVQKKGVSKYGGERSNREGHAKGYSKGFEKQYNHEYSHDYGHGLNRDQGYKAMDYTGRGYGKQGLNTDFYGHKGLMDYGNGLYGFGPSKLLYRHPLQQMFRAYDGPNFNSNLGWINSFLNNQLRNLLINNVINSAYDPHTQYGININKYGPIRYVKPEYGQHGFKPYGLEGILEPNVLKPQRVLHDKYAYGLGYGYWT